MKILIIVLGLFLILGIIGAGVYFWGNTFLYTEGLSDTQISTYTESIDRANEIRNTVDSVNRGPAANQKSLDKLQEIQESAPN